MKDEHPLPSPPHAHLWWQEFNHVPSKPVSRGADQAIGAYEKPKEIRCTENGNNQTTILIEKNTGEPYASIKGKCVTSSKSSYRCIRKRATCKGLQTNLKLLGK